MRLTPMRPVGADVLDGIIIGGGADVDPSLYGDPVDNEELLLIESAGEEDQRPALGSQLISLLIAPLLFVARRLLSTKNPRQFDSARDMLETSLIRTALEQDIPILGICRGAQLINIVSGGTLFRDLSSFYGEVPRLYSVLPRKKIVVTPQTCLSQLMGSPVQWVNSLHDQAINTLGQAMVISAREEQQVVQAIESQDHTFVLGVQWHPEYLFYRPAQRALFRHLANCARKHGQENRKIP